MLFAYIDSQGNEVPIPSIDALALRIELGAIGPDTQLYDAQADQWGPASSHEIFHSLSREKGDDGFVAPPPVAPPPPAADEAAPAEPEASADDEAEAEEEVPPAEEAPAVEEDGFPSFDLADAAEPMADLPAEAADADAADDVGSMDFALADEPALSDEPDAPGDDVMDMGFAPTPVEEAGEEADADGESGFDFGDMGSLELEGSPDEEEPEAAEPTGGGMELEAPLADADAMSFGGGDMGGGLELETPMSEFSSDEPPAWMEQDGPAAPGGGGSPTEDGTMDFAAPSDQGEDESRPASADEGASEEEDAPREKREPRSRPSPPRRRKSKTPLIMGVVAVAVLGGGGYFAMQFLGSRPDTPDPDEEVPALPAVTIPTIPAELLPVMRDLSEAALSDMVRELEGMQAELDLPAEPRNDWLSGSYLGQASEYEDLEQYWLGIEAFVDRVREIDQQLFHDMYVAQVEAAGIAADTAAILVERADSGFLASREGRFAAYNEMDDLINAALNLHDFLLINEQDITYEPAAGGVSRDPVLEAVPATETLGREMWEMVDQITEALDALGTLDRVTTERLFAVLFDRIRRAGVE